MNRPLIEVILTMRRPFVPHKLLDALVNQAASPPFSVTLITTSPPEFVRQGLVAYEQALRLRILPHPSADRPAALRHAATGAEPPLVLFLEEDSIPDTFLLLEHFRLHARHLEPTAAILGPLGSPASVPRDPAKDNDQITDPAAISSGTFSCKRALPASAGFLNEAPSGTPTSDDWASALIRVGLVLYRFAYSPLDQPPMKETHPLYTLTCDMLHLGLEPVVVD